MSKKKSGRRVWRGVTTATASLLALSVCASTVVDGFRTDIDKFLGTKSTKLVTENSDGTDLYTFKSDYTSTTDLLHGIQDVGERMSEEGSVLLKNNGALPLTKDETQKITLLGFSSYYPVQGGDMGSSLVENTGTDADTVDMVGAFKAKGFGLNQTVADMYEALKPTYKSEVQSWGGTVEYNHITAPSTTGVFSGKEPSQAAMDSQDADWKDSMNDNNVMIVTIARSASENGSYNPGTAGVDPTQNLNQTDPLGLSDDERDLINAAVTAKGFIHLINSGATALDGSGACVDAEGNHVMKPFWEMTDADIKSCLNATDWCRADYEYFRGGGYSSHFRCKAEMPVTMLRFNIVEGIGPVLQIAEGWTADLPDEIHNTIDKRTDPTWPTTWFCPRLTAQGAFTDVYSVMANWGANHGVTVYGHVGADLITLASMLRIPVTMHNVPAEKVYRPHAWASFGTQDQQAADYAACKQYGPLYR